MAAVRKRTSAGSPPAASRKGRLWKRWYDYFDRRLGSQPLRFLNYGMALPAGEALLLEAADEDERFSIQLYDRVVSAVDLTDSSVLEVSCGRGGGADYLARYKRPQRVVGLDRTDSALAYCRSHFGSASVHFVCGDALALPFQNEQFDAVVNVEASHCYPDLPPFLSEVRRVLRPGGHFLYADFRRHRWQGAWLKTLAASGMRLVAEEEITPRVLESLSAADDRKRALIREIAPLGVRTLFSQFAGRKGSMMYWAFHTGRAAYRRFCLRRD